MGKAKVVTSQLRTGRLQLRLSEEDEDALLEYCTLARIDKSQFAVLLIRKYGKALAEVLSREENGSAASSSA